MGFGSLARLNVHLRYHEKQAKQPVAHLANVDSNKDVELIILDAVKADDVDLVRDFIADVPKFSDEFRRKALVSSSCEMLEMLLTAWTYPRFDEQLIKSTALDNAVNANNLEATRMLLYRGASLSYMAGPSTKFPGIDRAIRNFSPEMIELLLSDRHIQEMVAKNHWVTPYLGSSLLSGLQTSKEARFIQCLSLLPHWTHKKRNFELCFRKNARQTCSIAIAEFCLRNGVDVNGRPSAGNTALYWASQRKGQTAAEFMKFLLESGADPLTPLSTKSKPIADQLGPRSISKWLGISWEQLVEESRKKHAASLEMGLQ